MNDELGREIDDQFTDLERKLIAAYLDANVARNETVAEHDFQRGWRCASRVDFLARWPELTGGSGGLVIACMDDDNEVFWWQEIIGYEINADETEATIRYLVSDIDGHLDMLTKQGGGDHELWGYLSPTITI